MPLNREELIRLKHQIEPNDYLVVESGKDRILVVRSSREYPDIVNDLDSMINKLDVQDANELSNALIIGEEEVVGVPLAAIESLIKRRNEEDEQIASDLAEKLIEPYTTLLFESENDPLKTLRLGIRVKGNLKDFKPKLLPEVLFLKIKSLPRHSEVVYLISEDGYIRLSGNEFYRRLREFLKENPNQNRELAKEFIYITRGRLADHFIDDSTYDSLFNTSKQENINNFISTSEETQKQEQPATISADEKRTALAGSAPAPEEIAPLEKPPVPEEQPTPDDEKVHEKMETSEATFKDVPSYPKLADEPITKQQPQPEPIEESFWKAAFKHEKNEAKAVFEPEIKPEMAEVGPEGWPSTNKFLAQLREKLPRVGMEVISGVEIPGVDLAVNNPESYINRIFFSYMPKFDLKKALDLERSMDRFSIELAIIVNVPGVDDADMRLFAVGKNIMITDIDTILTTNFLTQLEAKI
ncbi:hypothetical protein [[Eubacterium] cellulosolvens]